MTYENIRYDDIEEGDLIAFEYARASAHHSTRVGYVIEKDEMVTLEDLSVPQEKGNRKENYRHFKEDFMTDIIRIDLDGKVKPKPWWKKLLTFGR